MLIHGISLTFLLVSGRADCGLSQLLDLHQASLYDDDGVLLLQNNLEVNRDKGTYSDFRSHAATVENLPDLPPSTNFWIVLIVVILVACFGPCGPCALYVLARIIGEAVEHALEYYSLDLMGCQVHLDWIDVSIFQGYIHMANVKVENPNQDVKYTSEYLLQADEIFIDIDMMRLFKSWITVYEVEKVEFINMHVNYDRPSMTSSRSNLQDVLDHLKNAPDVANPQHPTKPPKSKRFFSVPSIGKARTTEETPTKIYVHELKIEKVSVKLELKGHPIKTFRIPPIDSKEFSQSHHNADTGRKVLKELAKEIIKAVFKSVLPNLPETNVLGSVSDSLEQAHGAVAKHMPLASCCSAPERDDDQGHHTASEKKPLY